MAKGFKHGGSGGENPLNFTVKAYPSEVDLNTATAAENTIGVATPNPVTGWYFDSEQPQNMAEGEVWFSFGTSGTVSFNALKNNSLTVYPVSAKQMVSGTLVDVIAKIYQDGEWVGWIEWFFNYGKQDYTWNAAGFLFENSNAWTQTAPTVTKNSDGSVELSIYCAANKAVSGIYEIATDVDFTNISTLIIEGSETGTGSAILCVFDRTVRYRKSVAEKYIGEANTLDVSNVSGKYCIGILVYRNGYDGTAGTVNCSFKSLRTG